MLISSICASNRPHLIESVIKMWREQTYEDKELVIVQNEDQNPFPVPSDILSVITPGGTSLGMKLNEGIKVSHGELIHKWDDDDIYSPGFLSYGVSKLVGKGDFCVWTRNLIKFPNETRIISWWGIGGSSIFTHNLYTKCPYRDAPSSVDRYLVEDLSKAGFKVTGVSDAPELFTYVRHGMNMWKVLPTGESVDFYLKSCSLPWKLS